MNFFYVNVEDYLRHPLPERRVSHSMVDLLIIALGRDKREKEETPRRGLSYPFRSKMQQAKGGPTIASSREEGNYDRNSGTKGARSLAGIHRTHALASLSPSLPLPSIAEAVVIVVKST
jgi:hypothetical protein